jgi:hypothetical protein
MRGCQISGAAESALPIGLAPMGSSGTPGRAGVTADVLAQDRADQHHPRLASPVGIQPVENLVAEANHIGAQGSQLRGVAAYEACLAFARNTASLPRVLEESMASDLAAGSGADAGAMAAFGQGDRVFLRPVAHGWLDQAFTVIALVRHRGWPHYELRAPDGSSWIASQLELAASPLWDGDESNRPRRLRRLRAAARAARQAAATEDATGDQAA